MLVIARRSGESVQIGNDIEVKVLRTGRFRVTIAIAAPRAVRIVRREAATGDAGENAVSAAENPPKPE